MLHQQNAVKHAKCMCGCGHVQFFGLGHMSPMTVLVNLPEAFFKVNVAQLHVHAGAPDGVDHIQHLLQLLQGDGSLMQLLIQPLQLLFQLLQDSGKQR